MMLLTEIDHIAIAVRDLDAAIDYMNWHNNYQFPDISKTSGGGLAIVDAKIGSPGTFLSFSTSPKA